MLGGCRQDQGDKHSYRMLTAVICKSPQKVSRCAEMGHLENSDKLKKTSFGSCLLRQDSANGQASLLGVIKPLLLHDRENEDRLIDCE